MVILRMGEGRSVIFPPSACPRCSHHLSASDLVPIFSWLWLRGKCRYCQAQISWQYPLVEAACSATVGMAFLTNELTGNFVLQAGWGVIWLAATVTWVRGEVRSSGPFLWPLAFFTGFQLLLATPAWGLLALCTVNVALVSLLLMRAGKIHNVWNWSGAILMGMLPMVGQFSWWWLIGLAVVLTQSFLPTHQAGTLRGRIPVFALNVAGLVLGILRGNWGL